MAKAKINPPGHPVDDSRYQPECQFALEPSVTKLLQMAEQAGWDPRQAAYAVMMLAAQAVTEPGLAGAQTGVADSLS
ncbi:MAG TPA: hypothetical protein VNS34_26865 [Rhizobiaceae bacterium]|nr:hypothetical protein [Rhizobiaceae bacterium]